ncbi:TPA_asm: polyprotein [Apostichopus japonicus associated picornavirus 5]|nr:TPA_asm: polyprotein [Apostichopus japonicus associated picornavirus 5]
MSYPRVFRKYERRYENSERICERFIAGCTVPPRFNKALVKLSKSITPGLGFTNNLIVALLDNWPTSWHIKNSLKKNETKYYLPFNPIKVKTTPVYHHVRTATKTWSRRRTRPRRQSRFGWDRMQKICLVNQKKRTFPVHDFPLASCAKPAKEQPCLPPSKRTFLKDVRKCFGSLSDSNTMESLRVCIEPMNTYAPFLPLSLDVLKIFSPRISHKIEAVQIAWLSTKLIGQAPPDDEEEEEGGFIHKIKSILKDVSIKVTTSVKDIIEWITDKVSSSIMGIFSFLGDKITDAVKWIIRKVIDVVYEVLRPVEKIEWLKSQKGRIFIACFCFCMILGLCVSASFLGVKLGNTLINYILQPYLKSEDSFIGQGPESLVSLGSLVCSVFGVTGYSNRKGVVDYCLYLTTLAGAGAVVSSGICGIFHLLPNAFRSGLILKFGTQTQKETLLVQKWNSEAQMMIRISKVPHVLASEPYFQKLKTLCKDAINFKIKDATLRGQILVHYGQLSKILVGIIQYKESTGTRQRPYSIHIYGKPGVGKSTIATRVFREVFGFSHEEVYPVPVGGEFWSGYVAQKAILIDEFLCGGDQVATAEALEYLKLINNTMYQPPMPALDGNIQCGIKGTTASPTVVVTLNNNAYDQPPDINKEALWRRRCLVIECQTVDKDRGSDLNDYSDEELSAISWIRFRIHPSIWTQANRRSCSAWMTYDQLKDYVQEDHRKFLILAKRLSDAMGTTESSDLQSPKEMMEEMLRDIEGVPEGNIGLFDAARKWFGSFDFFNLFSDTAKETRNLVGQGHSKKKRRSMQGTPVPQERPGTPPNAQPEDSCYVRAQCHNAVSLGCKKMGRFYCNQCVSYLCGECLKKERNGQIARRCDHPTGEHGVHIVRYTDQPIRRTQSAPTPQPRKKPPQQIPSRRAIYTNPVEFLGPNNQPRTLPDFCPDFVQFGAAEGAVAPVNSPEVITEGVTNDQILFPTTDSTQVIFINQPEEEPSEQLELPPMPDFSELLQDNNDSLPPPPIELQPVFEGPSPLSHQVEFHLAPEAVQIIAGEESEEYLSADDTPIPPFKLNRKERQYVQEAQTHYHCKHCNRNRETMEQSLCNSCIQESAKTKDTVLDMHHRRDGVQYDSRFYHRHICICNESFAHKHEHGAHEMLCSKCSYQGDWSRVKDEEYRKRYYLKKLAGDFYEALDTVGLAEACDPDSPNYIPGLTGEYSVIKNSLRLSARIFMYTFIALCGFRLIGRFFGLHEEDTLIGQSKKPGSPSKSERPRGRLTRGKQGQGPDDNVAELLVNGKSYRCVGLTDRWILCYNHARFEDGHKEKLVDNIVDGQDINLKYRGQVYQTKYIFDDCIVNFPEDYFFYFFNDPRLPPFKNITKKFMSENELVGQNHFYLTLNVNKGTCSSDAQYKLNVSYTCSLGEHQLPSAYVYRIASRPGDCGTPAIISSGPFAGRYLGIHVAGSADNAKTKTPIGVCNIVTKENILEAIQQEVQIGSNETQGLVGNGPETVFENLPNLQKIEEVPVPDRVFIKRKTALKKSIIAPHLGIVTRKQTPIMSKHDPRSLGRDPVVEMIKDTCSTQFCEVDSDRVQAVAATMKVNYQRMEFPVGKRELTFEEACFGIPSYLSSLNVSSSPGHPLVHFTVSKGKKDFIWFDEKGEPGYDPDFKARVLDFILKMKEGKDPEHIWLGYLKDEIVSENKVRDCRTRLIFASSLIATAAFRMLFGCILVAFNNARLHTPLAIGVNQFSYDLNDMYCYLVEMGNRFVAGDYRSFDKRLHPVFRDAMYNLFLSFSKEYGISDNCRKFFYQHETKSPAQIESYRFWTTTNHMSGCFLTTVVGSLVNEAYMRYIFMIQNPSLIFDQYVRMKVLIDDHVLSVREGCDFSPNTIQRLMTLLGQTYTNDDKSMEMGGFRTFGEISFLGAHPRKINCRWSGALRKVTLEESLLWTRDNNVSLGQAATMMVELCSQWDKEYYLSYKSNVNRALLKVRLPQVEVPSYEELRVVVANRTTESGHTLFGRLIGQGPPTGQGLVTLHTDDQMVSVNQTTNDDMAALAINETAMDITYGLTTKVKRDQFDWNGDTHDEEAVIKEYSIPYGVLQLQSQTNIQNMPFKNFIYWTGTVCLTFQVNGQPFQNGLLCVYFMPLEDVDTSHENRTACQHFFLQPDTSTTYTMEIPFRFPRTVINTYTFEGNSPESLGIVRVAVFGKLKAGTNCTVTMYSSFKDSKFTIPRPVSVATASGEIYRPHGNLTRGFRPLVQSGTTSGLVGQGQAASSNVVNNTYNVGDVIGDMPIQNSTKPSGHTMTNDLKADVTAMDNPPLAGGSIPVHNMYPSISKTVGVEPTTSMQLHPAAVDRQHREAIDPGECSIEYLCKKKGLIARFNWRFDDLPDTEKLQINLNSFLTGEGTFSTDSEVVPIFVLNQFMFWRADIVFEIMVVRTKFHSGRLRATMAYGAPSLDPAQQPNYYNHVLDFNGDNNRATFKIDYNAATQFLRTWEGPNVTNPVQDYSLGSIGFFVANQLRLPSGTVSDEVRVLIFAHFENVKVAVPRPCPFITADASALNTLQVAGTVLQGQGPEDQEAAPDVAPTEGNNEVADPGVAGATTESETVVRPNKSCTLEVGSKFEFCVTSILEVIRRGVLAHPRLTYGKVFRHDFSTDGHYVQIPVAPIDRFKALFAGWAGSLKYRIFHQTTTSGTVTWYPFPFDVGENLLTAHLTGPDRSLEHTDGTNTYNVHSTDGQSGFPAAREVMYPASSLNKYIDVNVPFQTHFTFMQRKFGGASGYTKQFLGALTYTHPDSSDTSANDRIFVSAGDDFTYLIFRPPRSINIDFLQGTPGNLSGSNVGGYVVG